MAEEAPLQATTALKVLLADEEIGIGTDDAFEAYKKNAAILPEMVAPKDLRTILQSSDLAYRNTRAAIIQKEKAIVLTWWSEAETDGDVPKAVARVRKQMGDLGFEETKEPEGRFKGTDYSMLRFRARELLTFQKVLGTCWQWVVVPVANRNARPGSKVEIAILWIAAAPPADGSLTLETALPLVPMCRCPPADAPILESMASIRFEEVEASVQDVKMDLPSGFRWARYGWKYETLGDVRTRLTKGIAAAGYVQSDEGFQLSERPGTRDLARLDLSARYGTPRTKLVTYREVPPAPFPRPATDAPPPAAPLQPGAAISALLKGAQVGTDSAFDTYKHKVKLSTKSVAPPGMQSLLTRPAWRFAVLDLGLHQDANAAALCWKSETRFVGELAPTKIQIEEQLKKLGFAQSVELAPEAFLRDEIWVRQFEAQEVLTYRKTTGAIREFVMASIVDRTVAMPSEISLAIKWYAIADLTAPLTLEETFKHCPLLRPAEAEQGIVDVLNRAPLNLWERSFNEPETDLDLSDGWRFRGRGWSFQTSQDIRPDLGKVLTSAGYTRSPDDEDIPKSVLESEQWLRSQDILNVVFVPGRPEVDQPGPKLTVSYDRSPYPVRP